MMGHSWVGLRKVTGNAKPLNPTVVYGRTAFGHGM
jgi:hypothetical protein